MCKEEKRKTHFRLCHSDRATAIPVTFLMLFVSLMLIISATYYIAMTRISASAQSLNFSAAKEAMLSLERSMENILWSPGASRICYVNDFGGEFQTAPITNMLLINITDNSFHEVIFNSSVGEAIYKLSYADPGSDGLFLKGDHRTIVNSSFATMAQLQISTGNISKEITLAYRPFTSSTVTGVEKGKPVNTVRIYIVSLNLSQSIEFSGDFRLMQKCVSVSSAVRDYDLSYPTSSIQVEALSSGMRSTVSLPISSNETGTIIDVEVLVCNIQLQKVGV
jgi:hypothetical protein